jgi:phage gp36-like protein
MAYETREGMIERFGIDEIQQLEGNIVPGIGSTPEEQAAIDDKREAVTNRALLDCSATADGYIAAKNALPLPVVNDRLKEVVADLARYKLYKDRANEEVRQRYEDAISWLKDVARGTVILVIDPAEQPSGFFHSSIFVV